MGFEVWVIYDHPRDYPDHYVLRRQVVLEQGLIYTDPRATLALDPDTFRTRLTALGLIRTTGDPDPCILEAWV